MNVLDSTGILHIYHIIFEADNIYGISYLAQYYTPQDRVK